VALTHLAKTSQRANALSELNICKEAALASSEHARTHRKRHSWPIPALIAFVSFLGGLASNLVASYIQTNLEPYRRWVWGVCILAGIAAVVAAIVDARETEKPASTLIENDGLIANADRIKESKEQPAAMSFPQDFDLSSKRKLVEALLACDPMKTTQSRDQVVADLPAEIGNKIKRHSNTKQDVDSIITTCMQFAGGVEKLLEAVRYYEGDTIAWQKVLAAHREALPAATNRPPAGGITTTHPRPERPAVESGSKERRAARRTYDVFLSHSGNDKPTVEQLAVKLAGEAGLKPFLDKWHLVPGEPWQEALEKALDDSSTCAVFLGPQGLGPWENEEMRSALDERVRDKSLRVIPVLLPGADPKDDKTLPRFLRRLTWLDFRAGIDDKDAFRRLVAGIRGEAPGPGGA
jgi:hypothetical protein